GFLADDSRSAGVRDISQRLFQVGNLATLFTSDDGTLSRSLSQLIGSDVSFTPSASDIGFVHRHLPDADIYFVANTSNQRQIVDASFRVSGSAAEQWDAMNGTISVVQVKDRQPDRTTVALDLEPYGSRILVFSRTVSKPHEEQAAVRSTNSSTAID